SLPGAAADPALTRNCRDPAKIGHRPREEAPRHYLQNSCGETLARGSKWGIIRRQVRVYVGTLVAQVLTPMAMPHSRIGCKRARKAGPILCLLALTANFAAAQELMTASGPG